METFITHMQIEQSCKCKSSSFKLRNIESYSALQQTGLPSDCQRYQMNSNALVDARFNF